ncbi:phospholipase D family protein [Ottowia sp.]|uniref:phospholipase D family protein n=1 Tax=Ottowia sp. TaxID=1898956 RepID=UPI003A87C862
MSLPAARTLTAGCLSALALLGGCALPPLQGRSESAAFAPDPRVALGQSVAPLWPAHPGQTGVVALSNGLNAFAARVHLADVAEKSLDLQYYIWHLDLTGTLMMQAVQRAADRGVRVRLLLDDNNTAGMDAVLARLDAHPHIELRLYNPFVQRSARWLGFMTDFSRLNRRMHNKSFTADGWVSVVGGRNIGDEYFSAAHEANFLDLDALITGAAVPEVEREFDRYWQSASAYPAQRLLSQDVQAALPEVDAQAAATYLQALRQDTAVTDLVAGRLRPEWVSAQVVSDAPEKTTDPAWAARPIAERMKSALGVSQRELFWVSPYFVPSDDGAAALAKLARAGVDTRVLTNSLQASDVAVVHAGYMKYRKDLLQSGVRLFELKPDPQLGSRSAAARTAVAQTGADQDQQASDERGGSFARKVVGSGGSSASLHAKTSEIDRTRLYVGSFNFDPRSIDINTEMGLVITSPKLAGQMAQTFESVTRGSYEVMLDEQGNLIWLDPDYGDPGQPQLHTTEPGTTWLQRLMLRLLSWLPIEGML